MRLAFDVDGVLADFIWSFSLAATDMGLMEAPFPTEEQLEWNFPVDVNPVWEEVKARWNWWMTLRPLVEEREVHHLNKAIAAHDVYFITSRPRTLGLSAERQTHHWLTGIGVQTAHASVIATKTGTKGNLCRALNISIMLDDCPANLLDLHEWGVEAVALRQPYNRDWQLAFDNLTDFLEAYA